MYAWYRVGGKDRLETVDRLQHSSFWPAAGRELLWRYAPAVEPKPRADWLADFRGCERIYPDVYAVSGAALSTLRHTIELALSMPGASGGGMRSGRGARTVAMCASQRPVVSRLVAQWRFGDCTDGFLVPDGREADAVAPLPLRALYLPDAAVERLTRIGLRQFGDVAKLERGGLDSLLGRTFARVAFNQCRGFDVAPQAVVEKPKTIVERVPLPPSGMSSADALVPYLEVACNRISFALHLESGTQHADKYRTSVAASIRVAGRLDLTLAYVDDRKRYAGATLRKPTPFACDMLETARGLAEQAHTRRVNVAAIELAASRLTNAVLQGNMFDPESRIRQESLEFSLNRVRARYGFDSIRTVRELAGAKS